MASRCLYVNPYFHHEAMPVCTILSLSGKCQFSYRSSDLPVLTFLPILTQRFRTVLAFSAGARGCIGKRFSITESICLLASLVRHYEILLPDDVDARSASEDFKRHALKWTTGITLTPVHAFVRLRKYTE